MKTWKKALHLAGSVFAISSLVLLPGFAVAVLLGAAAGCVTTAAVLGVVLVKIRPHVHLLSEGSAGSPTVLGLVGLFFMGSAVVGRFPDLIGAEMRVAAPPSPYSASVSTLQTWFAVVVFLMGLGVFTHGLACFWNDE